MAGHATKVATWIWLSASMAAGGALYLGLSDTLPLTTEVTAASAPKIDLPAQEMVSYQPPPLQDFDVIADRPLFSSDRKPYVPPPPEVEAEALVGEAKSEPPALRLVGIMLTDAQRSALFELTSENRVSWIYEGQAVDGWLVEVIAPQSATLRRGDREAQLELRPD